MVIICLSSGKCWIINVLFHFYPTSCSKSTDAWKRLLTRQSPLSLCIQIVRFQNDGKKLGNLIDYKEKVFFRNTITLQTKEPQQLMSHINWKLSFSMKAPRFPLVITFVTSKEETSGIIQVMPLSTSLQPWKPQAKKHTSFSMRKMTLKMCKRLDTFIVHDSHLQLGWNPNSLSS